MTTSTYEQTYVKYPFAPLVKLVLALGMYLAEDKTHGETGIANTRNLPHSA